MKRKITTILLAMLLAVFTAIGLFACANQECDHEYGEWTITTAAACETAGEQSRACAKCGEEERKEIEALGHDMQAVSAKAATCESEGWEAYEQCSRCDHNTKQIIDALGHENGDWSFDGTNHWLVCTRKGCGLKTEEGAHTFALSGVALKCETCETDLGTVMQTAVLSGATSIDITLNLPAASGAEVFAAIKSGLVGAKNGFINLTITGAETIPQMAFAECESLKSITLGDGVKQIGQYAFGMCTQIEEISLGSSVETIDKGAFTGCEKMTNIAIPNNITSIGRGAFSGSGLQSVTFGNDVTTIWDGMFYSCLELKNITIPAQITIIEDQAFALSGLTSITIPDTITSIGANAFRNCKSLESVTFGIGITTIPESAFYGCLALKTVNFSSSITTIEESAFSMSGITEIVIPDTVTSVEHSVFMECANLTSVTFGSGITVLNEQIFNSCTALVNLTFRGVITKCAYGFYCYQFLTENVTLTLAQGQKVLALADEESGYTATDVDFVGGNEFCGKTFKAIIIPTLIDASEMSTEQITAAVTAAVEKGVIDLTVKFASNAGTDEFNAVNNTIHFSSLEEVNLTITGVTEITNTMYYNYSWLKSITFGDGITTLGNGYNVIYFCGALESITIGKSVKNIGANAFRECQSLEKIIYEGTVEEWNSVIKGENWVKESPSVTEVVCSDGTVTL